VFFLNGLFEKNNRLNTLNVISKNVFAVKQIDLMFRRPKVFKSEIPNVDDYILQVH
jgi:hypothetical protein